MLKRTPRRPRLAADRRLGARRVRHAPRRPEKFKQKLVILGFDGMDPRLVEKWMGEGKLPNFKKLAGRGRLLPARDATLAGIADVVGVVRHRRQRRQAQHLRLPRPRRRRPTCPISAWCSASRRDFLFNYIPIAKPKITSIRGGTSFWVTAGQAGVRSSDPHGAGHLPARGRPERRAAVRPAAARHPRHDGHVLLLRDRPQPLRRRQHRDGRHPEAPGVRGRRRAAPSWSARPTRSSQAQHAGAARKKGARCPRPTRRGSPSSRRARTSGCRSPSTGTGRRARATIEIAGHDRAPGRGRVEQVGRPRLPRELPRPPARHGAALPDPRRPGAAALHLAGQLAAGQSAGVRCRRRRRSPRTSTSGSGTYRTLGWAEATWPLNEDRIDEKAFMDDLLPRLRRPRAGHPPADRRARSGTCSSACIESTDRVQHMMWRLHRPDAPDVRRGGRREVRRLDRARLPARATSSSARCCSASTPGTPV